MPGMVSFSKGTKSFVRMWVDFYFLGWFRSGTQFSDMKLMLCALTETPFALMRLWAEEFPNPSAHRETVAGFMLLVKYFHKLRSTSDWTEEVIVDVTDGIER